jgi:hypothetical protein
VGCRRQLSRGSLDGRWGRARAASALAALVVLAAVVFTLGFAQSALAGEGDQITGTVTSAASGEPIAGVEVCRDEDAEVSCVTTGSAGKYDLGETWGTIEFIAPAGSGYVQRSYFDGKYIAGEAETVYSPTTVDAQLPAGGTIEGVVTNASTKAPIAGVEVCASPSAAWPEEPTCVSTGADGVYEISGLAPVQYTVKFKPGPLNYLPETPQRYYERGAQVFAGETTANIDAALPEGAQIEGRVTSAATGLPVSGVQACATGFGPALETKCANTNAEGRYLIDGLETSSYHVSFWPERPYVAQHYDEGKTVWVNQGETFAGANASLLTGATISGDVTSASTGDPMREVKVCITEYVEESNRGYCTEPNEAGEYQLTGIATSTDEVEFRPEPSDYEYEVQYWNHVGVSTDLTWLHITVGEDITGIDGALNAKYGAIAGRVLGIPGGQGLSDGQACAQSIDNGQSRCANTNAQGEYEIKFLPSGRYSVEFSTPDQRPGYVPEFYDRKLSASEAEPVTVSAGSTTPGIDAELVERESAGSRISGVVSSISSQLPIMGIEVCAYDAAEEAGLFGRCATTEAGGEYSISGLPSGEYLVEFSSPSASGLNYVAQYYDDTESLEQAIAVEVGPETADIGIDAQMREGGRIAGQATDASTGAPIQGVSVCAYAERAEAVVGACANTGQNGQYTIAGLPNGEYEVEFSAPPESALDYVTQYFDGQSSAKAATLVPVTVGETSSGVDAHLQLGGRVTGRVTASFAGPLADMLVCALASPSEAVACALSNRDGEYAIAGVPAGSYVVGFDAGKSYVVQYYDDTSSYSDAQAVTVTVDNSTTGINAAMQSVAPTPPPDLPPPPKPVTPVLRQPTSESGAGASPQPSPSTAGASTPTTTTLTSTTAESSLLVTAPKSKIVISGSSAALHLSCSDAICRGSIELTMQVVTRHHDGRRAVSHREPLVLADGSFSVAQGKSATAVLHLTAAGRQRLARAKRHPFAANLILSVEGGKTIVKSVMAS